VIATQSLSSTLKPAIFSLVTGLPFASFTNTVAVHGQPFFTVLAILEINKAVTNSQIIIFIKGVVWGLKYTLSKRAASRDRQAQAAASGRVEAYLLLDLS